MTRSPEILIQSRRLCLRRISEADVGPPYVRWLNDPAVTRCLESRFKPQSVENVMAFVRQMAESPNDHLLAIVEQGQDRHVGNIRIGPVDMPHNAAWIGILIGERSVWGKGYGTEAIKLATEYSFKVLKLRRLTAGAYENNPGSIQAFRKAGYKVEGTLCDRYISDQGPVNGIIMGILNGEWQP